LASGKAATPRIYLTPPGVDADAWSVWDGHERFDFTTEAEAMDFVQVQASVFAADGRVPRLHVEQHDGNWCVTPLEG
jgi:hypothetical protein